MATSKTASMSKKTSTTTTTRVEEEKKREVPEGAEIVSKTVRTEAEQIENGWILSKNYNISYKEKGKEYNGYAYYSKKWYSEENPIKVEIEVTDKTLADVFDEDDEENEK